MTTCALAYYTILLGFLFVRRKVTQPYQTEGADEPRPLTIQDLRQLFADEFEKWKAISARQIVDTVARPVFGREFVPLTALIAGKRIVNARLPMGGGSDPDKSVPFADYIVKFFERERPVIRQAPMTIVLSTLMLSAAVGFGVCQFFKGTLTKKEAQIVFYQQQVAALQQQLAAQPAPAATTPDAFQTATVTNTGSGNIGISGNGNSVPCATQPPGRRISQR